MIQNGRDVCIMCAYSYSFPLFRIINAAIMPGIQPTIVRKKTIRKLLQPLLTTASGGSRIAKITRRTDIDNDLNIDDD